MRRIRCALWLALSAAGCIAPQAAEDQIVDLAPGMRLEVKGRRYGRPPVAEEVEQVRPGPYDRPDKAEISAPVEAAGAGALGLLGVEIALGKKTAYENPQKERVEPFTPARGAWLKVKTRLRDAELQARVVRRIEPRERFKLVGTLARVDPIERLLVVGGVPVRVQEGAKFHLLTAGSQDPLALFLADEQKAVPFTLRVSDRLRLGGELALKPDLRNDYNFDRAQKRDRTSYREDFKLDLLWRVLDNGSFVLAEASAGRTDRSRENRPDTSDDRASVSRAFGYFLLGGGFRLQVGRQDFYEKREWLYDEVLDAVRLLYRGEVFSFEAAAAAGREILDDNPDTKNTAYLTALARAQVLEDLRLSAYVVQRKDYTLDNLEPVLFGLRSYGRPRYGLRHWLELALARGYHGLEKLRGYAVDLGATYRWRVAGRPYATLGYARGSGRRSATGEGFRQTSLQDNNSKFGGVTGFRYYGELLDPELANLEVWTLGFGFRPLPRASVDFVFHSYRQHRAAPALLRSDLKAQPAGTTRSLGREFDLILGYRPSSRYSFELVAAQFDPGSAFTGRDPARKLAVQMRLKF